MTMADTGPRGLVAIGVHIAATAGIGGTVAATEQGSCFVAPFSAIGSDVAIEAGRADAAAGIEDDGGRLPLADRAGGDVREHDRLQ